MKEAWESEEGSSPWIGTISHKISEVGKYPETQKFIEFLSEHYTSIYGGGFPQPTENFESYFKKMNELFNID